LTSKETSAAALASSRTIEFRRLEIKYLIDRTRRTGLARELQAFLRPDVHGGRDGTYRVRSLYFDSPDYMAYHEKLDGEAERHKFRVRVYGEDPSQATVVRLEVKSRYLNYIQKITVEIPRDGYKEVELAFRRRTLPPAWLMNTDTLSKEFLRLQRQRNMEPKVLIQYRRQAFERCGSNRIRANFDDELVASRSLDLLGPLQGARRVLQSGHAIFELKVDGAMPYWMHMLIAKYDLQDQALSKYCYAVRSEARLSCQERPDDLSPFRLEEHVRARPLDAAPQAAQSAALPSTGRRDLLPTAPTYLTRLPCESSAENQR